MPHHDRNELIVQVLKDFEEAYQDYLNENFLNDHPEIRAQYTYAALLNLEGDPIEDYYLHNALMSFVRSEHQNALMSAFRQNLTTK